MNFHETKMGRIFFEHQLPQLIQSIQRLTAALDKPTQALTLPVEADPGTADMQLAYESGFRTAVQMLAAGLSRPGSEQNDDAAYAADGKER